LGNGREYPDQPQVGVGVVVLGPAGILLIRRSKPPRKGQWSLPGGGQKLGETVEECARREVAEETGLDISLIGLVDVVNSIRFDKTERIQYHYTLIDFAATVDSGTLEAGSDADGAKWFTREEITALGLWSETERIIDLAHEMNDVIKTVS